MKFNGQEVNNVLFNGNQVGTIYKDGVLVWENWKEKSGEFAKVEKVFTRGDLAIVSPEIDIKPITFEYHTALYQYDEAKTVHVRVYFMIDGEWVLVDSHSKAMNPNAYWSETFTFNCDSTKEITMWKIETNARTIVSPLSTLTSYGKFTRWYQKGNL